VIYLVTQLWPFMIGALVVGALIGWRLGASGEGRAP
jgi:hypothetical protein